MSQNEIRTGRTAGRPDDLHHPGYLSTVLAPITRTTGRLRLFLGAILHPSALTLLLILSFAVFFSLLSIQQHRAFLTHGLDIGNVDQALWNTAQGRFLHFTLMAPVESRLALHVEPILLFLIPFYWLGVGGPELLLVVQAALVALGAWPVYQLAINNYQLSSEGIFPNRLVSFAAFMIALAYLLLPALESAVLFDFHAVTLAPTFLLFAFLALEQRDNRRFTGFAILAMACKEDMPLVVALLGLYAGLAQRRWRLAAVVMGLSLLWFVIAFFVVQPRFAAGGNIQLDRYAWLGSNPLEMVQILLTRPALVFDHLWYSVDLPGYLIRLFFPTAFLALLSPLTLLPMLPPLAINLLSDNPFTWRLEDFHYGAPLAPFLFISAIYAIRRLSHWTTRLPTPSLPHLPISLILLLSLLLLLFSAVYHYQRGFTPLARAFQWPQLTPHHRQVERLLLSAPDQTALFTQPNLAPHLSQRKTLYNDFTYFTEADFRAGLEPVDDILLDVASLENFGGLHQFLQQTLLESGDYRLVTAEDGLLHLQAASQAGALSPVQLPSSFYSFVRPDGLLQHQVQVDFGEVMRLHGYQLHFDRQEEIQVTVDLELLRPSGSIQPVLYLLDAQGQPVGATVDLQPALVWFPVEQWPVGQIIRLRFNTLPWYTRETPAYRLALGVVEGADVWESRRALPRLTGPNELALRLPADGTLVELAVIEQQWGLPRGGPRLRQFEPPAIPYTVQANFDDQLLLLGHNAVQVAPNGSSLSVDLYWQALARPEALVRFVQLIGPDGLVYGQQDSAPDGGLYPTDRWQPGEVVVEMVTLPVQAGRPEGRYKLHIGLYRPGSGERLPLKSGGDHVEIPVIE